MVPEMLLQPNMGREETTGPCRSFFFFFFFCVAQYDCTQTTLTTTKPHLNGFTHEVTINGSLACLGLVGRKGP